MNLFWLGVGSGSFLLARFIILLFLRWRTGTSVHGILSVPRFELYLLILMLPCISQSAAFVIRGGTTGGIITGTLLLAIPAALILFVGLFLIISIFMGNFVHYSEISHVNIRQQWYTKLLDFLVGRPTTGRWFYRDGLTSSFLSRFGLMFEDRKGPPDILLVAQNEPHGISKWIDSNQSGIGRMRPVRSDDSNEETKVPMSNRILGCARSSYIILDLLRRVGLGIISGAHISHGHTESILASAITVVQLVYLFTLKPYIRRGVQCVESLSLLCEASIFGISSFINYSNPLERRAMGFVMLALFFISFVSQLVNEWYALIKCLLKLSNQKNPSFKIGMKCVAKGILLPFLPRKHWSKFISVSSKPNTGQVSVLPLSSETESKREDTGPLHVDPLIAMTATAIPELGPGSANHTHIHMTSLMTGSRSHKEERAGDRKQLNGVKLEPKSDLKKLRELAKASFSRVSTSEEGTCSYAQ